MANSEFDSSAWEPPSPEDLQRLLPQYEITGLLGRGGMGAVYKGRQPKLDRDVAIKLLPESFLHGGDEMNFAARFEQEARAMASLDHPAIVSVYDFGETSEHQLYFVMEYIDGMDIHEYLHHHGQALPQEQALAIVCHVLDALGYAHGRGVVHRDIKPANVLLNSEGRVKIADFGLAKTLAKAGGDDSVSPALTMTNMAMGTPDYAAPEMLEFGTTLDHRVDLYAVGVMLYQLLTGKLPRGNFRLPSELKPTVDSRLDGIVGKAMAADPAERYGHASEIRAAIDEVLSRPMEKMEGEARKQIGKSVGPRKASVSSGLGWGLGIGGAVAVAAAYFFISSTGSDDRDGADENTASLAAAAITPPIPEAPVGPDSSKETDGETGAALTGQKPSLNPKPDSPKPSAAPPVEKKLEPPSKPESLPDPQPAPEPRMATATEMKGGDAVAPGGSGASTLPSAKSSDAPGTPANIISIPGLETRLRGYLKARREAVATLSTGYLRALEGQLNQAADAGDLAAVKAWREEKSDVEELQASLASPPEDAGAVFAAARDRATLVELPDDAPETLVTLRTTWKTEREKIRTDLDGKLDISLKALESELTKARDFENAEALLAYRGSLGMTAEDAEAQGSKPEPVSSPPTVSSSPGGSSDPARATKEKPFENSLAMKFVPVPKTDVLFCIHETRWKDYAVYAGESDGVAPEWKNQNLDGFVIEDSPEEHPVVNIRWEAATKFCEWLSKKEGRSYRLPTDREWSIAVGIGRQESWRKGTTPESVSKPTDHFPWDSEWPPPKGAGNYSDQSRKIKVPNVNPQCLPGYDDGYPTTAPVMRFAPNEFGLYDLGGNVWEWCEDWYSEAQKDHVLRGGCWTDLEPRNMLSSSRRRTTPFNASHLRERGFRVVLELTGE